ncbi:hypothetical protein CONLIGDRAFT_710148 [Coniochaeta ligniaria NRRL 30616]|uniref:Aminoglycoside phosphotransferase domain-containing protein n=1 Tax=Coniochaeta ligniaria NRRL 30616 TaxID=1408157 RepID=A0A1J7K3W7_9PEZI|nr:hypothetical protein CONLIGDRAFT_710148 [Coniochaeta ligniaria NRRL 30616]
MDTPVNMETSAEMDDAFYATGDSTVRWEDRKLQALNLCKALWPSALEYEVHDRFVGTFNEIIPVTINTTGSESPAMFIIRLASQWGGIGAGTSVFEQVTTLQYIRTSTPIRVPEVIAYDTTSDNVLESPYLIMERLRGQDLEMFLDDMTAEQRKVLALELGQLYNQLRQIRSSYSGRIVPTAACHMPSLLPGETLSQIPITIEPYAARVPYDDDWDPELPTEGTFRDVPEDLITSGGLLSDPPNLPLLEMATRPFNRRIVQQTAWYPNINSTMAPRLQFLRDMMDVVVDEEHVDNPSNDYQLVHIDLFPRNIMVDLSSSPMITGIIDWDEAVFAPAFVADRAPTWLWEPPVPEDEEMAPDADDYVHPDTETCERSARTPATPELREVRRAWEGAVGRECVESVANPYAVLARRFLRFAAEWQWPYYWHRLYEETIKEWDALRDLEEEAHRHDESDSEDGSADEVEDVPDDDDDSAWETCSEDGDED